ncbi:MAG TPA: STAS domain-containing protein [Pseudonocardia sp.]
MRASEQPEFSVSNPADGVCLVSIRCELDMLTTPSLGQLLTQELTGGARVLVLDFADCDFIGSAGLATLVAARDQAGAGGAKVALTAMPHVVLRALEATGLLTMFDTYPSTEDAVAALAAQRLVRHRPQD